MERGGLTLRTVGSTLALAALLALPAAVADTRSPVQGNAWADYQADAGAILAAARGYDPEFALHFAFASASVYEVLVPSPELMQERRVGLPFGTAVPAVLGARHLGAGAIDVDPKGGLSLLLASDPRGFGVHSLPLALPAEPARFAVEALPDLGGAVDEDELAVDTHDLEAAGGLRYTVEGLAVEQPLRATVQGDIVAVLGRAPARVQEGRNVYAHDLGPAEGGERVLVVQARGATIDLSATGLTAVLRMPEAGVGAGAALVADLQGREFGAKQQAGVASDGSSLTFLADHALAGALLGTSGADPVAGGPATGQGAAYVPMDAGVAAAGAALGAALALAAVGLASLWAGGKQALFALLAPLYARLQTDEVLTNQTREAIFRHVVEHPGVNVSEVVKVFGLGWGATVYHLRVLERSHLVTASKQGRQVCYFQNGGRYHGQMAGISALRNDNAALVARMVLEHPGIQQREVCRITGLAQPTVSWHLQRLEQAGLVQGEGAPRKRYTALPSLRQLAERGFVHGMVPAQPAPPAATAIGA